MCLQCGKCTVQHEYSTDSAIDTVEDLGLHHK